MVFNLKIITNYSGGKGGVGKSTLFSLITVFTSVRLNVLLIDVSEEGGCSTIMLGNPEPPYAGNVSNVEEFFNAIGKYTITVDERKDNLSSDFYMIPNRGKLDPIAFHSVFEKTIPYLQEYFDLVLIDLPTFQSSNEMYKPYLGYEVLAIAEPSIASVNSIMENSSQFIYVLNVPRPTPKKVIMQALNAFKEMGIKPFFFPYDPAVSLLARNFIKSIKSLSKDFQKSLVELILHIAG